MAFVIIILGLAYLGSCATILCLTLQSLGAQYKNNSELQVEFVRKMKTLFKINLFFLG